MIKRLSLIVAFVLIPAAVWVLGKPLRLIIPQLNGVDCVGSVCVENPEDAQTATGLYDEAMANLVAAGMALDTRPTFVYCATPQCYRSFGGGNERAMSYPFLGSVIAPQSWQIHITQHELVHWFQFLEFGAVSTMRKPEWFREGMAYAYSDAPESDIPDHYRPMMQRYQQWHGDNSWTEILQTVKKM